MPDNTQYTRCPECHTAFKVSAKMLSMAKGKVRCGACLVVFQANDYILKAKTITSTTPAPVNQNSAETNIKSHNHETPLSQEQNSQNFQAQSSLDFNDDTQQALEDPLVEKSLHDEKDLSIQDAPAEEPFKQRSQSLPEENDDNDEEEDSNVHLSTAITQPSLPIISADGKVINEAFIDDEADYEKLAAEPEIEYEDPIQEQAREAVSPIAEGQQVEDLDPEISFDDGEISDVEINIDSDLDDFKLEDFPSVDTDGLAEIDNFIETDNFGETDTIAETFEQEQQDFEIPSEDYLGSESNPETEEKQEILTSEKDDFFEEEISANDATSQKEESFINELLDIDIIDEKIEAEDFEKLADNLTNQINETDTDPDPLDEFEERVEKKKTSLRSGIIAAVIIILLAIFSMKFWDNRQELAWDPTWGTTIKSICAVLPCDLKSRRDVTKISLRQRVVTPLESNENRLSIKLLLTNDAGFDQPYPTITINFSSPQGESIGIKRFLVKDYFPEKQNQLMPADAEVHISFETDLPHPNALGFEFDFE